MHLCQETLWSTELEEIVTGVTTRINGSKLSLIYLDNKEVFETASYKRLIHMRGLLQFALKHDAFILNWEVIY